MSESSSSSGARRGRHGRRASATAGKTGADLGAVFTAAYPAERSAVPLARREVSAFALRHGAAGAKLEQIALAVSEATTNVVVHAYERGARARTIMVDARLERIGELCVTIADGGSGLRTSHSSQGLGLGLSIVKRLADGVELSELPAGGLELRMRFALDGAPAEPPV